jgi:hypothetical protein
MKVIASAFLSAACLLSIQVEAQELKSTARAWQGKERGENCDIGKNLSRAGLI